MDTDQTRLHFLDYWRVIKSRKEIILAVLLLVVLTGTGLTLMMEKTYKAVSKIKVHRDDSGIRVFDRSRGNNFSPFFLATEYQVIKSRPLLEKVAISLDLPNEWGARHNPDGLPMSPKKCVDWLDRRVRLEQQRNTSVIYVKVLHNHQQEAMDIANKVAEVYQSYRLDLKATEVSRGIEAMESVARRQEAEVVKAEDKVEEIRQDKGITEIRDDFNIEKAAISKMEADLVTYEVEMITRKARMEELGNMKGDDLILAYNYLLYDRTLESVQTRLRESEQNLAVMEKSLGPRHPEYLQLQAGIATLRIHLEKGLIGVRKSLEADFNVSKKRFDTLSERLNQAKAAERLRTSSDMLPFERAKRERDLQRRLYEAIQARMVQEESDFGMPRDPVEIFEPAGKPDHPVSPDLPLNILISLLIGSILGVGMAFFLEYLDTSVKTVDDIEKFLGLPVIGVIPQKVKPLHQEGPDSIGAEAYRLLRTNLQFSNKGGGAGVFTVTSAGAGEGKSTTCFNLGYICASMGDRVLIVDADLRRPTQHKFFEISNRIGLSNVLMRDVPAEETIKSTPFPNLDFMPSGKLPRSSIGLIDAEKVRELIRTLKTKYDVVVIDAPPIMGVSDASILASEVDGVLQVIQYRKYPKMISARAKRLIENVGGNIIGVVLNRINIMRDDYYSYFQSYYTNDPEEEIEPVRDVPASVGTNGDRF